MLIPLKVVTVSLSEDGERLLRGDLGDGCDVQRPRVAMPRNASDAVEVVTLPEGFCNAIRFRLDAATGTVLRNP